MSSNPAIWCLNNYKKVLKASFQTEKQKQIDILFKPVPSKDYLSTV